MPTPIKKIVKKKKRVKKRHINQKLDEKLGSPRLKKVRVKLPRVPRRGYRDPVYNTVNQVPDILSIPTEDRYNQSATDRVGGVIVKAHREKLGLPKMTRARTVRVKTAVPIFGDTSIQAVKTKIERPVLQSKPKIKKLFTRDRPKAQYVGKLPETIDTIMGEPPKTPEPQKTIREISMAERVVKQKLPKPHLQSKTNSKKVLMPHPQYAQRVKIENPKPDVPARVIGKRKNREDDDDGVNPKRPRLGGDDDEQAVIGKRKNREDDDDRVNPKRPRLGGDDEERAVETVEGVDVDFSDDDDEVATGSKRKLPKRFVVGSTKKKARYE